MSSNLLFFRRQPCCGDLLLIFTPRYFQRFSIGHVAWLHQSLIFVLGMPVCVPQRVCFAQGSVAGFGSCVVVTDTHGGFVPVLLSSFAVHHATHQTGAVPARPTVLFRQTSPSGHHPGLLA